MEKRKRDDERKVVVFSNAERKIFAEGNFKVSFKIYNFLQEFIENHDEDKIREFCWSYETFKKYLPHCGNQIEDLYSLSCLISRHTMQKKNIPLDCFLYGLYRVDKEDIQAAEEILVKIEKQTNETVKTTLLQAANEKLQGKYTRCNIELSDALKKRMYRARKTEYIKDIYDLAFKFISF